MSDVTAYCSFCGISQHQTAIIIQGPGRTFICDGCVVDLCRDLVAEKSGCRDMVPGDIGLIEVSGYRIAGDAL